MTTSARWLPVAGAFAVGVLSSTQASMNGELAHVFGNGVQAAVWSFGSGWVVVSLLVLIALPRARRGVVRVLTAIRHGDMPWWQVLGGTLGGLYVAAQALTVPQVGIAVFTIAVVAGQSSNSLLVDYVGLGPAGRQPLSVRRIAAAGLAVLAVGVAVADRLGGSGFGGIGVLLALLAGVGIAVQQAMNGRVGLVARSPMSATFLNFTTGIAVLTLALVLVVRIGAQPIGSLFAAPWWAYGGGLIGIAFIFISAWTVPIVGVLRFALLSIAGQLSGAVILDLVVPTVGVRLGWNLVAGVLLAFVAVAISAVRPGVAPGAAPGVAPSSGSDR